MNRFVCIAMNARTAVTMLGIPILTAGFVGCGDNPTNSNPVSNEKPREGFTELLPEDPLRRNYDFVRVDHGGIIQENEVRNAGSHIDYGSYHTDELTVGIQGGETGMILDLGPDDSIAARLGVEQTVGGGQGFAHLTLTDDDHLNIPEADTIFSLDPLNMEETRDHVRPQPGHVYIMRVRDRHSDFDLIVKLTPVYYQPNERIAFQWVRLR